MMNAMKPVSMKLLLLSAWVVLTLMLGDCTQMAMQQQVRNSKTVVLDIGHYYAPGRGGQGARTPDKRYGNIEECEFWYRYADVVKQEIEAAGYTCIICNRGGRPADAALAAAADRAGVVQVNTPKPTAVYRSKHHPNRMAVGMLSVNYALDCKPACVIFLHHNSNADTWRVCNKGAFYTNKCGGRLGVAMAETMNAELLNKGLPNNDIPCGVIVRTDGRRGGGDWLNACHESYVPAAITEVAYLSNPEHARFLSSPKNARRYARTIGRGIVRYLQER